MFAEPSVLDGENRQFHLVGDLVAGNLESALVVQPGDRVPVMSVMVVTAGTTPSASSAEELPTLSAARLDAYPSPAATGNITPASITPAATVRRRV